MPTRLEDVPKELIVDFDITDPALADPHARLAEIQAKTPVAYSPLHGGYWMVTRYDDVHEVTRTYETFSNRRVSVPRNTMDRVLPLEYDPPEHTMYRQILNPLFSPARMNALEGQIRATATELIDAFASRGECEFITEFAHPLPTITFLSLMGWPLSDGPLFGRWTDEILVGKPGASQEEDFALRSKANSEVSEYFTEIIKARRKNPSDDATSILLGSTYGGERPLTDDELLRALWLLMLGGLHTVRGVLGFGLIQLTRYPEQRKRIIEDPAVIPTAVEELLRIEAPVTAGRIVAKPVTFRGVQMQPDDMVLVFLSAASRDPDEFEDPHSLQLDRTPNRHFAFSGGPHRCVGSHLGRIELAIGLEEIHRRIPDYELVADRPPRLHHSSVRGLYELPITFTPEK